MHLPQFAPAVGRPRSLHHRRRVHRSVSSPTSMSRVRCYSRCCASAAPPLARLSPFDLATGSSRCPRRGACDLCRPTIYSTIAAASRSAAPADRAGRREVASARSTKLAAAFKRSRPTGVEMPRLLRAHSLQRLHPTRCARWRHGSRAQRHRHRRPRMTASAAYNPPGPPRRLCLTSCRATPIQLSGTGAVTTSLARLAFPSAPRAITNGLPTGGTSLLRTSVLGTRRCDDLATKLSAGQALEKST